MDATPPEAGETRPAVAPDAAVPARRGHRAAWLLAGVVLVALVGAVLGWRQMQSGGAGDQPGGGPGGFDRPLPVRVEAAQRADIDVKLQALGTVTALQTATVRPRVDGLLTRVRFTEGQAVRAGDVLAEIDARPYEVALAQAEGQLARNQAELANARVDLARYQQLVADDAAPRQQLDAQAATVRQLEGTVKADQAAVAAARLNLSYTRITAPVSGRIGLRQVDAGNLVTAGDATGLAVIAQVQPISVVFAIPQAALGPVLARWRAGEKLPVQALARDGQQALATGVLGTVDNQVDVATGTVKLRAQFANDDQALFPNQFVNVSLRVQRLAGVVTVGEAAIQRGTPGTFVYVVGEGGKVAVRRVTLGASDGGRVQVSQGLQAGERVVADGADKLRDGAAVEVVEGPGAAPARAASGVASRSAPGAASGSRQAGQELSGRPAGN
jgi:multidrug efflux system membrane fusion protein